MNRDPATTHPITGRALALAMANELRAMRDLSHRLPLAAGLHEGAMIAAQEQDRLAQTLDELATFLEQGADGFGTVPTRLFDPALAQIRLAALAARLSGAPAASEATDGELELL